jgi:hypothetical protein
VNTGSALFHTEIINGKGDNLSETGLGGARLTVVPIRAAIDQVLAAVETLSEANLSG